ncbi:MAG: hypothetical protein EOP06_25450 [Proteobacteria bacterium]|nr:MAG: hypothetical protein EOP06_25450 [Pseudomonadota bacterium]
MTHLKLVLTCLVLVAGFIAKAETKKEDQPGSTKVLPKIANKKADASTTSHNFEDLLVQGKYHFSEEAVSTVEDDKVLDSLIGVRSDFKDRLKSSSGSY